MRIAQVAPLVESVPPRLYGGTERVVLGWLMSWLNSGMKLPCLLAATPWKR
jgi:hypothetical protein